jgi:hypothetical protein
MSHDTMTAATLPTSFGVFKPVGHLMVGLPTQADADALAQLLAEGPRTDDDDAGPALHFAPADSVAELQALVEQAGPAAGFGYEITLLRRYLKLAQAGARWLLVPVRDTEAAAAAAEVARRCHALLAVHYRTLTVEELI